MARMFPEPEDGCHGDDAQSAGRCRIKSELAVARRMAPPVAGQEQLSPPFFTQHGRQLLLLDEGAAGWVVAEFFFDADQCRYVELRRACYDWPREAAGALLSRTLPAGADVLAQTAAELLHWIDLHAPGPDDLEPAPLQ